MGYWPLLWKWICLVRQHRESYIIACLFELPEHTSSCLFIPEPTISDTFVVSESYARLSSFTGMRRQTILVFGIGTLSTWSFLPAFRCLLLLLYQGPPTRKENVSPLRIFKTTASLTRSKVPAAFVRRRVTSVLSTQNQPYMKPLLASTWANTSLAVRLGGVVIWVSLALVSYCTNSHHCVHPSSLFGSHVW